jgi:spore coat protein U-like protein
VSLACLITVSQLAFGMYDPRSAAPHDSTGTVRLQCPTAARVSLGGGADRRLRGARGELRYGLYLDAGRTVPWGDGSRGTSTLTVPAGRSTVSVFARIHARQNLPPGNYADSVIVIVDF